jgi:flagellar M-ring protein FliF
MSGPQKHSLSLRGHRTSVTLEPEFWAAFQALAAQRGVSINALAAQMDEARGDVLTLKSLAFEPLPEQGTLASASLLAGFNMMTLIQTLVLGLVALVLGLFVIKPMLAGRFAPMQTQMLPAPEGGALALPGMAASGAVLTGEIDSFGDLPMVNLDNFDMGTGSNDSADPVARLRRLIEERQAESVEILRGWMEQEEEKA